MSDRGPRPRTEREWGCAATSGKGRCESLLLSVLLSATPAVRDQRHLSHEAGQTGPGEIDPTFMGPFHQGVAHATNAGGTT